MYRVVCTNVLYYVHPQMIDVLRVVVVVALSLGGTSTVHGRGGGLVVVCEDEG